MVSRTIAQIAASVLLHAGMAGLVLAFSSGVPEQGDRVYRVTLAEFAAPAASASGPAPPPASARPEIPEPEPAAAKPPEPKTKTIRAKKTAHKAKPKQEEQPAPPPAPVRPAPSGRGEPSGAEEPAGQGETAGRGDAAGLGGPSWTIGGIAAYDSDAVDQRPAIARRIVPEYPLKARRMNVQGKVLVRLVVDAAGNPRECAIHQAEPAGYFEEAALAAARKTRFIPGKIRGKPVNTVVLLPFVFVLR